MNIENLLYESESDSLDFKEEQYKFISSTDEEKSEMIKDVLAFANSWKRSTGFILVGVKEHKGEPAEVVGIKQSLDDASIQQFIQSKINRPITFSYKENLIGNKKIGVFEIPEQERPLYLLKKYGKLEANLVYIRRGSSTAIASPEEIAKMGRSSIIEDSIDFELSIYDKIQEKIIGDEVVFEGIQYEIECIDKLPEYIIKYENSTVGMELAFNSLSGINKEYYKEYAKYYISHKSVYDLCLRLKNTNKTTIYKISGQASIPSRGYHLRESYPLKPKRNSNSLMSELFRPVSHIKPRSNIYFKYDYQHDRNDLYWWSTDIFPGEEILFKDVFFVFNSSCEIKIKFCIVGENIQKPREKVITITAIIKEEKISNLDLITIAKNEKSTR